MYVTELIILVLVVATALAFDFTNGFHDTGNAMATSIATGALRPKVAVALSAVLNLVGAVACAFLAGPWARSEENQAQYKIALGLLAVGVVLWAITWFTNRAVRSQATGFRDVDHLE